MLMKNFETLDICYNRSFDRGGLSTTDDVSKSGARGNPLRWILLALWTSMVSASAFTLLSTNELLFVNLDHAPLGACSTITYGYVNLDNASGQAPTFYHTSHYASANIIWQLRKRLSVGLEGLYGLQTAQNGVDSNNHWRLQLGMVYSLFD